MRRVTLWYMCVCIPIDVNNTKHPMNSNQSPIHPTHHFSPSRSVVEESQRRAAAGSSTL